MVRSSLLSLLTGLLLCLASCSDDADIAPPYRMDMGEAVTDATGRVASVLFDDGRSLMAKNNYYVQQKNASFRALAVYVEEGNYATLAQVLNVLTSDLLTRQPNDAEFDPVRPVSIWRSRQYLNCPLRVPSGPAAKVHTLGAALTGVTQRPDGKATAELRFLHKQGGDDSYYYRDVYYSCNLTPLNNYPLVDSLRLTVVTDRGESVYLFAR